MGAPVRPIRRTRLQCFEHIVAKPTHRCGYKRIQWLAKSASAQTHSLKVGLTDSYKPPYSFRPRLLQGSCSDVSIGTASFLIL